MSVEEVTSENFDSKVNAGQGYALVDFWAPWCGPCRAIAPVVEELSELYASKVNFMKVNVDEAQELAVQYKVQSIPTLLFVQNGSEVDRVVGVVSKEELKVKLDALVANGSTA